MAHDAQTKASSDASPTDAVLGSSSRGPALVVALVLAAVVIGWFWWQGRPAEPEPTGPLPLEASVLTGPDDALPELLEGELPPTPNIDIPLAPTIMCRLHIDTEGTVVEARVYRPRLQLASFEREALRAVKEYRFSPAKKAGEPVAVWIHWPITFDNDAPTPERSIQIKGSDTIGGALGPELAMAYNAMRPSVKVDVEALGSSTGFVGLFDGSAAIGASSRKPTEQEVSEAKTLGVELREVVVGYDGIVVIVHRDNPVAALSLDQVAAIFRGEVTNWSEVGGHTRPIRAIGRPEYSGTHVLLRERVLRKGDATAEFAQGIEVIESSDTITAQVAKDPAAIAYVGMGWVTPRVKQMPLQVDGNEAVAPGEESVRQGDYPVVRPLLMYTRGVPSQTVADFLRFVLSPAGQALVREIGFVPAGGEVEVPSRPDAEADEGAPEIERLYFEVDSAQLDPRGQAQLQRLASRLKADDRRLLLVGNADVGGGKQENLETAYARAEAVSEAIAALGIAEARVELEAASDLRPISTNMTRAGRTANRRVDIFITEAPPPAEEGATGGEDAGTEIAAG